jgi:hypothetical protein
MTGKYIIGGGISGLLYAYYNRDFTIISPDLGGKLNSSMMENIIYLHATPETEEFLREIGMSYTKKTQMIKYLLGGRPLKDLSIEDKIMFIRKKLNDPNFMPEDLNLSTSDYYISVFEIDYRELLDRLMTGVTHIDDSVIKITGKEIITEQTRYSYDKLVSTVNAKIFWRLYDRPNDKELRSEAITFVLCDKLYPELENCKFDLCYVADWDNKVTRVSKRRRDQTDSYLYEFSGKVAEKNCLKYLPEGSKILDYRVEENGLIFSDINNIAPPNVLFLGRFATWNHADKQQDVIRAAKVDFELQNVWNIQKRFTSNFVDFNSLKDVKDRERLTKDYFVALMPELTEVINEINYKQHKQGKKVNRELLLEELIDTFKYYLNILLMWDITPDEFVRKFKEKSQKVQDMYESGK